MAITPERRKQLLHLLFVAAAIDVALKLIEIPFLEFLLAPVIGEEILEQFLSTWLAKGKLNLTLFDRVVGFIPIPGVTPLTVRVIRELFFHPSGS